MGNKKRRIAFDFDRLKYVLEEKGIKPTSFFTNSNEKKGDIGISFSNYKSWKQTGEIAEQDLELLAEYLNVSFDWLKGYDFSYKTKAAPFGDDYIRDKDGYIIPCYSKDSIFSINRGLKADERLFFNWLNHSYLYDWVNKQMLEKYNKQLTEEEYIDYMNSFGSIHRGEALYFLAETISERYYLLRIKGKKEDE